ncbi:MAG: phosphoglucosamine mutase [Candidatus Sumerlaeaceae bacterium]
MSRPMISVAGIRGIVGDSLLPEEFLRYVLAFATLVDGGPVVVGSDSRLSREMMRHLAFAGLTSAGCTVHDIGLAPTPTVGMMVRQYECVGGIAITASHNPAQWNAYKFFDAHGSFLDEAANARLLEIAATGEFRRCGFKELGKVIARHDAIDRHVTAVLEHVDVDRIRARKFRVVVDCVNGVGSRIVPLLLERLGCEANVLYTNVDAEFPHNPEPLPENLAMLSKSIEKLKPDVGFAVDPDADRLAIADETGRPIGEERTLTLAAAAALERAESEGKPLGPLVANLSTTRAMDDVAARFGVRLFRTPIGEAHVVARIRSEHALIGGEGNGGVIYPPVHHGRDAATGIALILDALARAGDNVKVSELNSRVPDYIMIKTKFDVKGPLVDTLADAMRTEFADASELVTEDGVKAVYPDCWVHARPSGTEPVVRIFAEAPDQPKASALVKRARKAVIGD